MRYINTIGKWGRAEKNLNSDNESLPSFNVHLLSCCPAYPCNWFSPEKGVQRCCPSHHICAVQLCFYGHLIQVRPKAVPGEFKKMKTQGLNE